MSGRAWCKEQCFDPSQGFADEGWGFEEGEEASGILDWERRHLASVSKKHGLQTVFISNGLDEMNDFACMVQVPRPSWYPYDGLEAPLGTFVDTNGRMVPAEGADVQIIVGDWIRVFGLKNPHCMPIAVVLIASMLLSVATTSIIIASKHREEECES
jgi:hypothetical protein